VKEVVDSALTIIAHFLEGISVNYNDFSHTLQTKLT
jgi:hypothetical protein